MKSDLNVALVIFCVVFDTWLAKIKRTVFAVPIFSVNTWVKKASTPRFALISFKYPRTFPWLCEVTHACQDMLMNFGVNTFVPLATILNHFLFLNFFITQVQ